VSELNSNRLWPHRVALVFLAFSHLPHLTESRSPSDHVDAIGATDTIYSHRHMGLWLDCVRRRVRGDGELRIAAAVALDAREYLRVSRP